MKRPAAFAAGPFSLGADCIPSLDRGHKRLDWPKLIGMNKAEQIEREFTSPGILRGGLLLLHSIDALDMVQHCRHESASILGIDAFKISANSIQPLMEDSVDFSSETRPVSSIDVWQEAELFLRSRQHKDLVFEIALDRS